MTFIYLKTEVDAKVEIVFNAAHNLDIHLLSTSQTQEKIIAGKSSGLIEKGDTVTWKAKHFGLWLTHKSFIPEMAFPAYFVDEMLQGQFKSFRHEHLFEQKHGITIMTDTIRYETPFGFLGKLFDKLILKNYLIQFIAKRNQVIKKICEDMS